jgi:transglutaminase-like putative cysteine protease
MLAAREFCFESPLVPLSVAIRAYAEPSFPAGRPLVDAVSDLIERIFENFVYDPGFTTVTTPIEEVLRFRRGVCQDFAHLAIGCLRSMGLAARYVSGYLETAPPPGGERAIGADASHAWLAVFVPGGGWLDVDPTNDQIVGTSYVTTAWGRDYSDVSPLKGIVFGGGNSHALDVSVDVTRLAVVDC